MLFLYNLNNFFKKFIFLDKVKNLISININNIDVNKFVLGW